MAWSFAAHLLALLIDLLTTRYHSERAKDLEIALLRQQLRLLQRQQAGLPRCSSPAIASLRQAARRVVLAWYHLPRRNHSMPRTTTAREVDALIARHIGPHPSNPGLDEYWLREPGVPIWAVIGAYQAEGGNADEVAAAYAISREQVEAALAYYHRHQAVIDNRLAQNMPA
jgi:uncharacterized protein (DUF433 family)